MGFARDVADSVVFMDRDAIVEQSHPDEIFSAPRMESTRAFLDRLLERNRGSSISLDRQIRLLGVARLISIFVVPCPLHRPTHGTPELQRPSIHVW